jgi:hypothetical protein
MNAITPQQFAIFRIVFGFYLAMHFIQLAPDAAELFSRSGMLGDARLNFTYGLLPNPLERWDSPAFVTGFVLALAALATAFMFGVCRRLAAVLLWFGWACLFNRNNLISNPSLPYIGMLLLMSTLVPIGESLRSRQAGEGWEFPGGVYLAAWTLLAICYGFSGWTKLQSPSWVDGSALSHVLDNPLARPGFAHEAALQCPAALRLLAWGTVVVELLFVPLSFHRLGRLAVWSATTLLQCSIVCFVAFADLTLGMLIVHLFTFDRRWLVRSAPETAATPLMAASPSR